MKNELMVRADEGADPEARAKEIENAVKAADAKKRADAEAGDPLTKILGGIEKLTGAVEELAERVESLEGDGTADAEERELSRQLEEEGAPKPMAADARRRSDRRARRDSTKEGENLDKTLRGADSMTSAERAEADRKDAAENLDHQSRADAVANAWGERAPRAMSGENPHDYRLRLLSHWQKFSPQFKEVDLGKLPADALAAMEPVIYADATKAAANPTAPANRLIARTATKGGHEITTFFGHPSAWMARFAGPMRRHVVGIKTDFGR